MGGDSGAYVCAEGRWGVTDLTAQLDALVADALAALDRGETVQIGPIKVSIETADGHEIAVSRRAGGVVAFWSAHDEGRRRVLRDAVFSAMAVEP